MDLPGPRTHGGERVGGDKLSDSAGQDQSTMLECHEPTSARLGPLCADARTMCIAATAYTTPMNFSMSSRSQTKELKALLSARGRV